MTSNDTDLLWSTVRFAPRMWSLICHARGVLYRDGLITLEEYDALSALARVLDGDKTPTTPACPR